MGINRLALGVQWKNKISVFYTTLLWQCCTYAVRYRPQHVVEHHCSSAQGESDTRIELEAALSWAEPCVRSFSSSLMWVFLSVLVSCCEATVLLCLFHVRLLRGVEYYDCIHSQAYLWQTQRLKQSLSFCCCDLWFFFLNNSFSFFLNATKVWVVIPNLPAQSNSL